MSSTARRDRAWKDFAAWCRGCGLTPLPAHPWTVAAYVRWCERRHRQRTIVKRIRAIARAHLLAGAKPPDRHPTVTRTLRAVEARRRRRAAALFRAEDFTAPRRPGEAAPASAARRRRVLRTTPRLVPRRPAAV